MPQVWAYVALVDVVELLRGGLLEADTVNFKTKTLTLEFGSNEFSNKGGGLS